MYHIVISISFFIRRIENRSITKVQERNSTDTETESSYNALGAARIQRKITVKSFAGKRDLTTELSVKKRDVFLEKKKIAFS